MEGSIFDELANFLRNSSDGQKVIQNSNLPSQDVHKVAQEVVPKIAEQVKSSPQTLGDLFKIFAKNKDDPQSMLNSNPGFDHQKAHNEGQEILSAIFGSNENAAQVANEVAQKTGISATDINSLLPTLAAMATKLLGGKADNLEASNSSNAQGGQSFLDEILGALGSNQGGSPTSNDELASMGQQIFSRLFSSTNNEKEG